MINVFISQPMAGRPERDILEERKRVLEALQKKFSRSDSYGFNYHGGFEDVGYCSEEKIGARNTWYLGGSIQHMDDAHIIVFCPGWKDARGCFVEYVTTRLYRETYDWIVYMWDGENGFEKAPDMHGMIELPMEYW